MSTDLIFLHCGYFPRCQTRVDKHFTDYYSFQYMSRGTVELSYDDQVHQMSGKWVWPAYPGPRIRFHPGGESGWWEHRYVAFSGGLVARWISEGLFPMPPQQAGDIPGLSREFDLLLSLVQQGGRWKTRLAINHLERMLIELAEHRRPVDQGDPWLADLLLRLDGCKEFVQDYEALAEEYGISTSTMRRRFRQVIGVPLHTYAMQCRASKAKVLLGESDLSIKQVAQKLGFIDVYYFSKQFKAVNGVSPGAYRRSRQR